MPLYDLRAHLQRRFDEGHATFKAANVQPEHVNHPATRAWLEKQRQLDRLGFELPKDGLYVVAAFAGQPRNRLQAFGRYLYYRNPQRYHRLLPCLGEVYASRPGHAGPGQWKPPEARR